MAANRRPRQSVTTKGVCRRLDDLCLDQVHDARGDKGKRFDLCQVLGVSLLGLISGAVSLSALEDVSESQRSGTPFAVGERIADNVFSYAMAHLTYVDLQSCLRRQARAEWRRKNLAPSLLSLSCIAMDGKALTTLKRYDFVRLVRAHRQVRTEQAQKKRQAAGYQGPMTSEESLWLTRKWEPTDDDIRAYCITNEPWLQLVEDGEGKISHIVIKMLRSTSISSNAALCVDQMPIPAGSNEIAHAYFATRALIAAYGDSDMFQLMTCDAGITSLRTMTLLYDNDIHYFAAVKANHQDLFREVCRLHEVPGLKPVRINTERAKGKNIVQELYVVNTPGGFLKWTHMKRVVRSRRIVTEQDGTLVSDNSRYYVTSLGVGDISLNDLARLNRCHWRCENEGHWTADVSFLEDAKRATLSRTPQTMVAWSYLRAIALNIQALMRTLSRILDTETGKMKLPSWRRIAWHFMSLLFDMTLDTSLFDRVDIQTTMAAAPS